MVDADGAAVEVHLLHMVDDLLQSLLFAPAFAQSFQIAVVTCPADDAHSESAGNFGDQRIHATVVGKIVQGLQGEDQVRFLPIVSEILINRRRSLAPGKKLLRPLDQEFHLAAGGERV